MERSDEPPARAAVAGFMPDEHPGNVPLSEEQLAAATVGELQALNGPVVLAPYDPNWPTAFASRAEEIRRALGEVAVSLEHVGSTSVPGLSAKPILDMVLAVPDSSDEASYVPALGALGYELRIREPEWHEHRMLRPPDAGVNLHVFSLGCSEVERMLRFRDWLRTHPEERLLYEETKQKLAARTWKYVQNYADAKSKVVEAILARAGERVP